MRGYCSMAGPKAQVWREAFCARRAAGQRGQSEFIIVDRAELGLDTERMFVYNVGEQMVYWHNLFIRRKEAGVWQRTCLNARKGSWSSSRSS
jgi:hypothetical protein